MMAHPQVSTLALTLVLRLANVNASPVELTVDRVVDGQFITFEMPDYPDLTLPVMVCPECKDGDAVDMEVIVEEGTLVLRFEPNAKRTKLLRDEATRLRERLERGE